MSLHDRVEFWCISFMHDKMYGLFTDGKEMLLSAELKEGDKVLEVGCGPGFFTLPAAEIVLLLFYLRKFGDIFSYLDLLWRKEFKKEVWRGIC